MIKWEYVRIWASGRARSHMPGGPVAADFRAQAREDWLAKLNEMGAKGWELISESALIGGNAVEANQWVEYSGTMKRPRSAE